MANFFDEIHKNNLITIFLVSVFFVIVVLFGLTAGYFLGSYTLGVVMSVVIGIIYTIIAFYQGSNMVLALSGAKEVSKKENPYLLNIVEGLAIAAGLPTPKVYIVEDKSMNAFAAGMKPEKSAIAVTRGLLENMNKQQLEGVIGHEMSHIKHHDTKVMIIAAVLAGVIVLIADILMRSFWWGGLRGRGSDNNSYLSLLLMIVGMILIIFAPFIALSFKMAISRRREFMADAGSAELTRYPKGLAEALEKIEKDTVPMKNANSAFSHLYISEPKRKGNWFAALFSSHPPIKERIKRLLAM